MNDNNITLEERAELVEKTVDEIKEFKAIKKIQLSHLISEKNFDIRVSKIEESLLKDIKDPNKLKAFEKINDKINDALQS